MLLFGRHDTMYINLAVALNITEVGPQLIHSHTFHILFYYNMQYYQTIKCFDVVLAIR